MGHGETKSCLPADVRRVRGGSLVRSHRGRSAQLYTLRVSLRSPTGPRRAADERKRAFHRCAFPFILCAEKSQETVELLELDQGSIHVAQYLTKMPPKKLLEEKLAIAIANAKEKLEQR